MIAIWGGMTWHVCLRAVRMMLLHSVTLAGLLSMLAVLAAMLGLIELVLERLDAGLELVYNLADVGYLVKILSLIHI